MHPHQHGNRTARFYLSNGYVGDGEPSGAFGPSFRLPYEEAFIIPPTCASLKSP